MSVPDNFNILNISGTFTLNRGLSGDTDKILALQGVSWWKRKIISIGTVTLYIKHYTDEDDHERIDIDQTITGGIPGTSENRTLTWTEKENEDHVFGSVIAKSRRIKAEELDVEFLKTGWTADTIEHGVIQAYAESNTPKSHTTWIGNQVWGVEVVNDERRYARHVDFTGPQGESVQIKMFYDYKRNKVGPLDS